MTPCMWYAACQNAATTTRKHPVLGDVPICERCDVKAEALTTPKPPVWTRSSHPEAPALLFSYTFGRSNIDVGFFDAEVPFTNINVWDHALGAPTITTEDEFRAKVDEWVKAYKDDIPGYREENQ